MGQALSPVGPGLSTCRAQAAPRPSRLFRRFVLQHKRRVPRTRLARPFPYVPLLRIPIVLQLVDQLLVVVDLFQQSCVLLLELAHRLPLVPERSQPLRPAQHDSRISGQRDQPAQKYNRSKNRAVQSRVKPFTFLYNLVLGKRPLFSDDFAAVPSRRPHVEWP